MKILNARLLFRRFLPILTAATSIWKSKSFGGHCAGRLEAIGHTLLDLSGSSESEFIALGEKLMAFHQRTTEMSRLSSSVTELLSCNEVSGASQIFQTVFSQVKEFEKNSGRSVQLLDEVLENLSATLRNLDGFRKLVMFLRVICIAIRMETARLDHDENGMGILADEVAKMIVDIDSRHSQLLEGTESLIHLVRQTSVRLKSLESVRNTHAEAIFDHTLSCLRALADKQARSAALAADTAAHYDDIATSIGEIVTSMQFHDITRQRVEHMANALLKHSSTLRAQSPEDQAESADIAAGIGKWAQRRHAAQWSNRIVLTGDMCELQAAQLDQAMDEFVGAVEKIVGNLEYISTSVSGISCKNSEFARTEAADNTCVADLQSGVTSIMSSLREYGAIESEVSNAMDTVGKTLSDLCRYAEGIRAIGARMKLIALNAIVKASQLKEGGESLGVLAESIHKLSIDSGRCIQSVTHSLEAINNASSNLSSTASDSSKPGTGIDTIANTLEGPVNILRNADHSAISIMDQLNEQGRALSRDIDQSASGIMVHHLFQELASPITLELRNMAESSRSLADGAAKPREKDRLDALQSCYTMESERLVHGSVLSGDEKTNQVEAIDAADEACHSQTGTIQPGPAASIGDLEKREETHKDEEDFGDNVELF